MSSSVCPPATHSIWCCPITWAVDQSPAEAVSNSYSHMDDGSTSSIMLKHSTSCLSLHHPSLHPARPAFCLLMVCKCVHLRVRLSVCLSVCLSSFTNCGYMVSVSEPVLLLYLTDFVFNPFFFYNLIYWYLFEDTFLLPSWDIVL